MNKNDEIPVKEGICPVCHIENVLTTEGICLWCYDEKYNLDEFGNEITVIE